MSVSSLVAGAAGATLRPLAPPRALGAYGLPPYNGTERRIMDAMPALPDRSATRRLTQWRDTPPPSPPPHLHEPALYESRPGSPTLQALKWLCLVPVAFIANHTSWYFQVSDTLGGSAVNGKQENGHYFLGNHGQYIEVTSSVYYWSLRHGSLVFPSFLLAGGLLLLVYTVDRWDKAKRRSRPLSDRKP